MIESKGEKVFKICSHVFMMFLAIMAIMPIVLLISSSFTANDALISEGYFFWPSEFSLENYKYLFEKGDVIARAYMVSIVLTVSGTIIGTSMTVLMGYGLSRPDLPGRGILMLIVVITMLFNGGLVPTYIIYTNVLHVKNTFWGLLLPGLLMNGFNIMLVKSYFVTAIPHEIFEAAEIDGANEFTKVWRIAIPMAVPIIATIALFIGIAYWNDWNNGYVYISTRTDLYSIQNFLNRMQQNLQFLQQNSQSISTSTAAKDIPSEGIRMAIAALGILPVIAVYPWMQKYFVKGLTLGGVKG